MTPKARHDRRTGRPRRSRWEGTITQGLAVGGETGGRAGELEGFSGEGRAEELRNTSRRIIGGGMTPGRTRPSKLPCRTSREEDSSRVRTRVKPASVDHKSIK